MQQWCKDHQLTKETRASLYKENITSEEDVASLTRNQVDALCLTIGQGSLLYTAARTLALEKGIGTAGVIYILCFTFSNMFHYETCITVWVFQVLNFINLKVGNIYFSKWPQWKVNFCCEFQPKNDRNNTFLFGKDVKYDTPALTFGNISSFI